jgi:uncharacterized protein (TIGR00251 family)
LSTSSDRPTFFSATRDGVRVFVRLAPKASANRIAGIAAEPDGGTVLKVMVTAVPEDGKANAALIKLLAKAWRIPARDIGIVQGAADRRKMLHVAGDAGALTARLAAWQGVAFPRESAPA